MGRVSVRRGAGTPPIAERVRRLDWPALEAALSERGFARTPPVLTPAECSEFVRLDADDARFRSRIDMARHRFGEGRYGYFAHPLPRLIASLRHALYLRLAPVANAWMEQLGSATRYPPSLDEFLARCAARGQHKPTPLLLRYEAGRLQLPAPGPLRRRLLPAPDDLLPERSGHRLRRRRVPARRAATTGTIARRGRGRGARRDADLPQRRTAAAHSARPCAGAPAPRGQHGDVGRALGSRHHFPRRALRRGICIPQWPRGFNNFFIES
jgi:hypothetical protein